MTVRCKFHCAHKDEASGQINFSPVYSGSDENKAFFRATPSGSIVFQTVNPAAFHQFEVGKEYYVDFTPAS
jgi:hypothetical protein